MPHNLPYGNFSKGQPDRQTYRPTDNPNAAQTPLRRGSTVQQYSMQRASGAERAILTLSSRLISSHLISSHTISCHLSSHLQRVHGIIIIHAGVKSTTPPAHLTKPTVLRHPRHQPCIFRNANIQHVGLLGFFNTNPVLAGFLARLAW
ncbi:hypothetical protein EYC84_005696 [Monilinia fructicola]|uniref:Uncharacterized protein n=1 Tax=Monilinia fructicola TaxID=38448 RepID=A0A5M9K2G4_MONFR|nr:hypothetical protein EYC84_005696 [Monilinia fructicola]